MSVLEDKCVDKYPPQHVRDTMVRRFAWIRTSGAEGSQSWGFYASNLAGFDASGRPGNVFTVVVCSQDGRLGVTPGKLIYGPEIPVPFGAHQIESVELPSGFSAAGPIDERVLRDFLTGWEGPSPLPKFWAGVSPYNEGASRGEILKHCESVLRSGKRVVVACLPEESCLWVSAVLHRFEYNPGISFSTLESAYSLSRMVDLGCHITVVDRTQLEFVAELPADVVLVDVSAPLEQWASADAPAAGLPSPSTDSSNTERREAIFASDRVRNEAVEMTPPATVDVQAEVTLTLNEKDGQLLRHPEDVLALLQLKTVTPAQILKISRLNQIMQVNSCPADSEFVKIQAWVLFFLMGGAPDDYVVVGNIDRGYSDGHIDALVTQLALIVQRMVADTERRAFIAGAKGIARTVRDSNRMIYQEILEKLNSRLDVPATRGWRSKRLRERR